MVCLPLVNVNDACAAAGRSVDSNDATVQVLLHGPIPWSVTDTETGFHVGILEYNNRLTVDTPSCFSKCKVRLPAAGQRKNNERAIIPTTRAKRPKGILTPRVSDTT